MTARVLVADEQLLGLQLLKSKLSDEYMQVETVRNGADALIAIDADPPDIVLLEIMLPDINGFEVCERIKSNPLTMHIPVVLVAAFSGHADVVRGLEAGADDFLTKPFKGGVFSARVRSLVRLKMLMDEWRSRERTSESLTVLEGTPEPNVGSGKNGRVLIIDDTASCATELTEILAADGHESSVITIPEASIEKLATSSYDMVIIELRLKNLDALRLCAHIRSINILRHLPILLLADEDDLNQVAKAMDLGCNDYVLRPIESKELQARCRTQIRRRRYQKKLRDNYERSFEMALSDGLTGLYNRRYLEAHLGGLIERIAGGRRPFSVIMFDIDHFKKINDLFGHAAGDEVLQELCTRVMKSVRSFDTVARYGGEEFVVVMPGTDINVAMTIAERLRQGVANQPFTAVTLDQSLAVTISVGVTEVDLAGGDTMVSLINRADEALYAAKSAGRNQVIRWNADGNYGSTVKLQH
ncbi:MAG: PleD family two-component system response regulator [Pseudomonadota bacterium]|nr:PleD family two-component system response regulator [Pseudomonadota bacterium]